MPRKFLACLLGGLLLAGCEPVTVMTENSPGPAPAARTDAAPSEPRIVPIPPIPSALRGCWFTDGPDDPEEPGAAHRLLVTAGTIELIMEGSRQVATADYVSRVSPTLIEGLFSAPDGKDRSTIATSLMFGDGGDYGPQGSLRRAEGDAGSDNYARCPE